jgi:hypothetical protein
VADACHPTDGCELTSREAFNTATQESPATEAKARWTATDSRGNSKRSSDTRKAHDVKIAGVFREEGVSGTKDLENRAALLELMTALHSNGVKLRPC